MNIKHLQPGERVQLGGDSSIPMTVIDIGRETGFVFCRWFDDHRQTVEGHFPAHALNWWGKRQTLTPED